MLVNLINDYILLFTMKNIIIINLFVILFAVPAYSDDWLLISELFNGNKIYIDPDKITYTKEFVEAPIKQIFNKPITTQKGTMATAYETNAKANCEYKKVGFFGVKAYNLEGNVFYTDKNYNFWPKGVAEHSAGDNIIDYLCDRNFKDNIQQKILQN